MCDQRNREHTFVISPINHSTLFDDEEENDADLFPELANHHENVSGRIQ
jgi:hypothetical protein